MLVAMDDLIFGRQHALSAIEHTRENGISWLYEKYKKPGGRMKTSSTGFLMHDGESYPTKPLGRLANSLAGSPMTGNPNTSVFNGHFADLGFQLIAGLDEEAEDAADRQRRLAEVWSRPKQAKFRRAVFGLFGARCLITGCQTLAALEAAHILTVADRGSDKGWNGIPLRSDLHRLFDANLIGIEPGVWKIWLHKSLRADYGEYHELSISSIMENLEVTDKVAKALAEREVRRRS